MTGRRLGLADLGIRTILLGGDGGGRLEAGKVGYFDLFHEFGTKALMLLSFTLAWTISPIALQRIQAARSAGAARKGLWVTAAALLGLYLLIVGVGTLSLPLFPRGTGGRPLVAEIAGREAGFALGGLVFVAVLAAILSTLDTAINAGALVLNRDIIDQAFPARPETPGSLGASGDRDDRRSRRSS